MKSIIILPGEDNRSGGKLWTFFDTEANLPAIHYLGLALAGLNLPSHSAAARFGKRP